MGRHSCPWVLNRTPLNVQISSLDTSVCSHHFLSDCSNASHSGKCRCVLVALSLIAPLLDPITSTGVVAVVSSGSSCYSREVTTNGDPQVFSNQVKSVDVNCPEKPCGDFGIISNSVSQFGSPMLVGWAGSPGMGGIPSIQPPSIYLNLIVTCRGILSLFGIAVPFGRRPDDAFGSHTGKLPVRYLWTRIMVVVPTLWVGVHPLILVESWVGLLRVFLAKTENRACFRVSRNCECGRGGGEATAYPPRIVEQPAGGVARDTARTRSDPWARRLRPGRVTSPSGVLRHNVSRAVKPVGWVKQKLERKNQYCQPVKL